MLNELSINHNQLIALAMLVGTDYNKGIYGIGQKKAVKLVQKYGNDFEKMFNELKWSDEYSWEEVFNHLKNTPVEKHYSLKWKKPDKESMMDFLAIERQFNRERLIMHWKGVIYDKIKEIKIGSYFIICSICTDNVPDVCGSNNCF